MPLIRITKRIITMLLAIGVALPIPAFAQSAPQDLGPEGSVWLNPSFQVGNITVQNKQDAITGTVDVLNDTDASFGNIRLQLLLMEPAPVIKEQNTFVPDNARIIDRVILPTTETFSPQEKKNIAFTYTPPKLPTGDYRIRLQVITSNGNAYGWDDYALKMGTEGASFVLLSPGPLTVKGEAHNPIEGPNIEPGSTVTVSASTKLVGAPSLTVTPVLTTYAFDLTGKVIATQKEKPVTLTSAKETEHTFSVQVSDTPGAYQTTLTFVDASGKVISSMEQYRWVVSGVTARVISGRFLLLEEKNAEVQFEIAGPADGVASVDTGIKVFLLDADKVLQDESTTIEKLGENGLQSGKATFAIDAMPKDPGFRIVLTDTKTGAVLDTYEAHVKAVKTAGKETKKSSVPVQVVVGIIAVFLLFFAVWWYMHTKGKRGANLPLQTLLLVASLGLSIYAMGTHSTRAGAILIYDLGSKQYNQDGSLWRYYIIATINKPIHNNNTLTQPVSASDLPIEFTLVYGRCNNTVTKATARVDLLNDIGHIWPYGRASLTGRVNTRIYREPGRVYDSYDRTLIVDSPRWTSKTGADGTYYKGLVTFAYSNEPCASGTNCEVTKNYTGSLNLGEVRRLSATLLWFFETVNDQSIHNEPSYNYFQSFYTWTNFVGHEYLPVAVASMSVNSGPYSNSITVTRAAVNTINFSAKGSYDKNGTDGQPGWAGLGGMDRGKCEWDRDFNYIKAVNSNPAVNYLEHTINNPATVEACNTSISNFQFNIAPGTYTYDLLRLWDGFDEQSNVATGVVNVLPDEGNRAPIAFARVSTDGKNYGTTADVTEEKLTRLSFVAFDNTASTSSRDPDGWIDVSRGVSDGGQCAWNGDLKDDTFERIKSNPTDNGATACGYIQSDAERITLTDPPGTSRTYKALQITDRQGLVSNIANVTLNVVAGPKPRLMSFSSTAASNTYGPGALINITATYDKKVHKDSTLRVKLNNGVSVLMAQNKSDTTYKTMVGAYRVGVTGSLQDVPNAGNTIGDYLSVASIVSENVGSQTTSTSPIYWRTNSIVPPTNISTELRTEIDTFTAKQIRIDTTPPVLTMTSSSNKDPVNGVYPAGTQVDVTLASSEPLGNISYTKNGGATFVRNKPNSPSVTFPLTDTATIVAYSKDDAGNQSASVTNTYTINNLLLQSFSSTTGNDTYGPGRVINITATYNKQLDSSSSLSVRLNNGVLVPLATVSGLTITGTYSVGATGSGQDVPDANNPGKGPDLTVASIEPSTENVKSTDGAVQNSSTLPQGKNLGDTSDILIDTTAPVVTISPSPSSPYSAGTTLTIDIATTAGGTIYYTDDGSMPNLGSKTTPLSFQISATKTITAFAQDRYGNSSFPPETATYTIATPVFKPGKAFRDTR